MIMRFYFLYSDGFNFFSGVHINGRSSSAVFPVVFFLARNREL